MKPLAPLAAALLAALAASPASLNAAVHPPAVALQDSSTTTSQSVIPPGQVAQMLALMNQFGQASDFLYVPTWEPPNYGWEGGGLGKDDVDAILTDSRYRVPNVNFWPHSLQYRAEIFKGSLATCARTTPTLHPFMVPVTKPAWRCVRAATGRVVRVYAYGPNLAFGSLVRVVDSAKPAV